MSIAAQFFVMMTHYVNRRVFLNRLGLTSQDTQSQFGRRGI